VTSHYTECLTRIKKDERHVTGLFGPNLLTAYSRKSSKNILNNITQHSKGPHVRITHKKERSKSKKKKKYIYKLPRPSHNVYSKIVEPWLSEGSLPRAIRCVSQTKFLSSMAETNFREQEKMSTQHHGHPGKRTSLNTIVRERRKVKEGKGREGGDT
jgi:hypothetical protein